MGEWLVDVDVLARSCFAVSPMHEVTARLLELPDDLATDGVAGALVALVRRHRWVPDLLVPPPAAGEQAFEDELTGLRTTDPRAARHDLHTASAGVLPPALDRPDIAVRLAGLAEQVWDRHVAAAWPRLRQLLTADITRRSQQISRYGWAATIGQLSPRLGWLGDGRLRINAHDRPAHDLAGGDLVFVPSSSPGGWVSSCSAQRYAVTYPAAGLRAEPPATRAAAVDRLIGGTRAGLLRLLADPLSTTQLAAATGLSLGGVADHLRVLLDARLVDRRRAGPVVLYQQTQLARDLLHAPQRAC